MREHGALSNKATRDVAVGIGWRCLAIPKEGIHPPLQCAQQQAVLRGEDNSIAKGIVDRLFLEEKCHDVGIGHSYAVHAVVRLFEDCIRMSETDETPKKKTISLPSIQGCTLIARVFIGRTRAMGLLSLSTECVTEYGQRLASSTPLLPLSNP